MNDTDLESTVKTRVSRVHPARRSKKKRLAGNLEALPSSPDPYHSGSKLPIPHASLLCEVHHGIAASAIPIPFKTIYQNWKEQKPKLHQYSPDLLQVVYHRRSGDVETCKPRKSSTDDVSTHSEDDVSSNSKDYKIESRTGNSNDGRTEAFVTEEQELAPSSPISSKSLSSQISSKSEDNIHLSHKKTQTENLGAGLFMSVQTSTAIDKLEFLSSVAVQTEDDLKETIVKSILPSNNLILKSHSSQTDFKGPILSSSLVSRSIQTHKHMAVMAVDYEAKKEIIEVGMQTDETMIEPLQALSEYSTSSSCLSCYSLQEQVHMFEAKIHNLVELLESTTENLTIDEGRLQKLSRENQQLQADLNDTQNQLQTLKLQEKEQPVLTTAECTYFKTEISNMKSELDKSNSFVNQLKEELTVSTNKCLENENEVLELKSQKMELEFKLKAAEDVMLLVDKKLEETEHLFADTTAQLRNKAKMLEIKVASFNQGMNRLKYVIERPVALNEEQNEKVNENVVQDLLSRAEGFLSQEYTENQKKTQNNIKTQLNELVSVVANTDENSNTCKKKSINNPNQSE